MFDFVEMEAALSQLYAWYTERFSVEHCAEAIDQWRDSKMVFHQSLPDICRILRDYAEHPGEYAIRPALSSEMNDCGKDLFPRRAILIGGMTDMVIEGRYTVTFSTEMWFTEEMQFANVSCIRTHFVEEEENAPCISEYRKISNYIKSADDLRIPYDTVEKVLEAYKTDTCRDNLVIFAI